VRESWGLKVDENRFSRPLSSPAPATTMPFYMEMLAKRRKKKHRKIRRIEKKEKKKPRDFERGGPLNLPLHSHFVFLCFAPRNNAHRHTHYRVHTVCVGLSLSALCMVGRVTSLPTTPLSVSELSINTVCIRNDKKSSTRIPRGYVLPRFTADSWPFL